MARWIDPRHREHPVWDIEPTLGENSGLPPKLTTSWSLRPGPTGVREQDGDEDTPKDRGPLGISLWLDFDCTVVLDVPRSSFRPQPEVDSSVIGMKPVSRGHISEEERVRIRALSSWCFGRRRKKIRTSLKSTPNPVQRVLGISRLEWDYRVESLERLSGAFSDLIQRRPEELEPESWVKLSRMVVEELDLPE